MSVIVAVTVSAVVKPGIEVLRDGGFAQLQGKRVGLVTNPSGIDNNLKPFECVGEIAELRRAYHMKQPGYPDLPFNVPDSDFLL